MKKNPPADKERDPSERILETLDLARTLPIRERFAVTALVAAQFIGISRTRVYELLQSGVLEGRLVAGRRIVLVESLLRLVAEAPTTRRERAAA